MQVEGFHIDCQYLSNSNPVKTISAIDTIEKQKIPAILTGRVQIQIKEA